MEKDNDGKHWQITLEQFHVCSSCNRVDIEATSCYALAKHVNVHVSSVMISVAILILCFYVSIPSHAQLIGKLCFSSVFYGTRTCRWMQTLRRNILKMEKVWFPEILVSTYKSTWRHNPEKTHNFNAVRTSNIIQTPFTFPEKWRALNPVTRRSWNMTTCPRQTAWKLLEGVKVTPWLRFTIVERTHGTHWIGGWEGLRACTQSVGKNLCLCCGPNPGRSVCSQTLYWLSYLSS
jgi:hypothetical protein